MENELLKDGVSLVDFWAPWCGPCKALTPILNDIEVDLRNEKFNLIKVNVDDDMELAQKYNIKAVPTLLLFKDSTLVKSIAGVRPKQLITEEIKKLL